MARFPKSVSPGDPIPTGSEAWNAILGAAHEHRQAGRPDAPPARGGYGGVIWALGLNDTGANLPKHKPVAATGVGGLDVSGSDPDDDGGPPWQRRPLLTLSEPAAVTDWVCVTLDAIPAGEIGRVAVSGLTLCDVDSASGATWAAPQVGDTAALLGGSTGTVRVLHVPDGEGSQRRCVVYLHERPGDSDCECVGNFYPLNTELTYLLSNTTFGTLVSQAVPSAGRYLIGFHCTTVMFGLRGAVIRLLLTVKSGGTITQSLCDYHTNTLQADTPPSVIETAGASVVATLNAGDVVDLSAVALGGSTYAFVMTGAAATRLWFEKLCCTPPTSPPPPPPPPPISPIPPSPLTPPPPPVTAGISGTVYESPSGAVVSGRSVVMSEPGGSSSTTTTDVSGVYSFSGVVGPSLQQITVDDLSLGGAHSVDGGPWSLGTTAEVVVAAATHVADFVVGSPEPSATVNVTVQNAVGSAPLSGRTVTIGSTSQTTNGSGQTSFAGVGVGSTNVVLTLGGSESASWAVDTPSASGKGATATFTSTDGGTHGVTYQVSGVASSGGE